MLIELLGRTRAKAEFVDRSPWALADVLERDALYAVRLKLR
jgi:hypothetical protein